MKVALCQIDTTVGDLAGNRERIIDNAGRAVAAGAAMAVFPELALVGYPPRDLLDHGAFVEAAERAFADLVTETGRRVPDLALVVGHLARNPEDGGKPLFNAASLLRGGAVATTWHKALLPTYDVFDEARYFEPGDPGHVYRHRGEVLGVTVCEDIWNDKDFWARRLYPTDPVDVQVAAGASVLLNLSASPFHQGKPELRERLLHRIASDGARPLVFVNLVGGNDSLVFDGHSVALDARGRVIARARGFAEDLAVVDLATGEGPVVAHARDATQVLDALTLGLRDYLHKCGFTRAVLGLSGGIDSALTACIAVRALGRENVLALGMPSPFSSQGSIDDALALAQSLGIECRVVPITPVYEAYVRVLSELFGAPLDPARPDLTLENVQARIRGALLMATSNRLGALLLTTGNKSEMAMGYCTLYGDMAGGLAVISDLPKTLVYRLADEVNRERDVIPRASIEKPPSAELRPGQKDEDSLPPYPLLDAVLAAYVDRQESVATMVAAGLDEALVRRVVREVDRNEYKRRQAAPGLRVTTKAFGEGRRLPIAQRFRHP